jgi:hypothetical protein
VATGEFLNQVLILNWIWKRPELFCLLSLVATNNYIAEKCIANSNRTSFSSRSEQTSRAICFTDSADGRNGGAFQYSQRLIVRDRLEALMQKSGDQLEKAILS